MHTKIPRLLQCLCVLLTTCSFITSVRSAHAFGTVKFVITAGSAFLRSEPNLLAPNTVAVFNAEQFNVSERTSDNLWVRLDVPRANGTGTWLLHSFGQIIDGGDLNNVPARAPIAVQAASGNVALPGYIPTLSTRMRAIYQNGLRAGRDPNMFTVVGDCNSEPTAYIGRVASGIFQLPAGQSYLQGVIAQFGRSFSRISLAARGGYGTSAMMDPTWADPFFCHTRDGEGPFPCELRFSNASIVFIELGTGDQYKWREFESNYRPLLDNAIGRGVVPVLVTKADDLESHNGAPSGFINGVIRRVAAEYGAPLLDFEAATRPLPNYGLIDEGNADFHLARDGSDLHILTTLQTLQAIIGGGGSLSNTGYRQASAPSVSHTAAVVPARAAETIPATGLFTVNAPVVNIRDAPGLDALVIGRAVVGQQFTISAHSADSAWLKVGDAQWIYAALGLLGSPSSSASPVTRSTSVIPTISNSNSFTISVTAANIRNAPRLTGAVVGGAFQGQQFDVLERSDDNTWVRVGLDQWIFAALGQ